MNEDKRKELLTTPLQYSYEEPSDRTFVVPPANLIIPQLELLRIILELDRTKKKKLFEGNLWILQVFAAHPNARIIDEVDPYGFPLVVYTDNNGITRIVSENSLMDFDTNAPTISSYDTNSPEERKRRAIELATKRENPELWLYYYGSPAAWIDYTGNKANFDILKNSAELASLLYGAGSNTGRYLLGKLGLTGLGRTAKVVFNPYTIPGAAFLSASTAPFAVDMYNNGINVENAFGVGLGVAPYAIPTIVRAYNAAKPVATKWLASNLAGVLLGIDASRFDGTVPVSYFKSPDKWYRITETPEVNATRKLLMGTGDRSIFNPTLVEEIPIGSRIGFKTGEMPIEGLRSFTKLPNGRFRYDGEVIPYKLIFNYDARLTSAELPTSLRFFERPSKLTPQEKAGIPKGERNQPLNTHLKGDAAVLMFREYGGVDIPKESINGEQLRKYVQEARLRYGLVGNKSITDEEIARALYKKSLELGEGSAAVNSVGEPQLLFRGDSRRYTTFNPRLTPEELAKLQGTMDNSLGTLFLGQFPFSANFASPRATLGVDRYLATVMDFNGVKRAIASGTGSLLKLPNGTVAELAIIDNIPEGSYLLLSIGSKFGDINKYKLPADYTKTGVNDLNVFVVRTPAMRNSTREISTLNDDFLIKNGPNVDYYGPEATVGLSPVLEREYIAKHYRSILDDAELKGLGLLKSSANSVLREEHAGYDYFAIPNFNRNFAKHILSWDLRNPVDWGSPNIYKANGGKIIKNKNYG